MQAVSNVGPATVVLDVAVAPAVPAVKRGAKSSEFSVSAVRPKAKIGTGSTRGGTMSEAGRANIKLAQKIRKAKRNGKPKEAIEKMEAKLAKAKERLAKSKERR